MNLFDLNINTTYQTLDDKSNIFSDDDPSTKPPKSNPNHYSKRSTGSKASSRSSTERKVAPDDWIPAAASHDKFKQSTDPKIINYELQVLRTTFILLQIF